MRTGKSLLGHSHYLTNQFILPGSTETGPSRFATTPGNSECGSCFVGPRLYLSPLRATAQAAPGRDHTEATEGGGSVVGLGLLPDGTIGNKSVVRRLEAALGWMSLLKARELGEQA